MIPNQFSVVNRIVAAVTAVDILRVGDIYPAAVITLKRTSKRPRTLLGMQSDGTVFVFEPCARFRTLRSQYVLSYRTAPGPPGARTLDIRCDKRSYRVRCRKNYDQGS